MTTCEVTIARAITPEDLAAAYAVRVTVFVEEQGASVEGERDEYDEEAFHWLAKCPVHGGVGTVRLIRYGLGKGKIGRLAVLHDHRGIRLGKRLMEVMDAQAQTDEEIRQIICHAQSDKLGFYKALGYTLVPGDIFYEEGIPHRKMVRDLPA